MKPRPVQRTLLRRRSRLRPLMIGPEERALIAHAIELARANVIGMDALQDASVSTDMSIVKLADRKPLTPDQKESLRSYGLELPVGYTAAISFEQQPAGLCRHLSISVADPKHLPNHAAIKMISEAFGMVDPDHAWIEEFLPGHYAVNLIEVMPSERKH